LLRDAFLSETYAASCGESGTLDFLNAKVRYFPPDSIIYVLFV
jgi:hypothetical protein